MGLVFLLAASLNESLKRGHHGLNHRRPVKICDRGGHSDTVICWSHKHSWWCRVTLCLLHETWERLKNILKVPSSENGKGNKQASTPTLKDIKMNKTNKQTKNTTRIYALAQNEKIIQDLKM